jgi:hypothetical protein
VFVCLFVCLLQVVYKVDFFLDYAFIVTTTSSSVFDTMSLLPRLSSVFDTMGFACFFVQAPSRVVVQINLYLIYLTDSYHIFLTLHRKDRKGNFDLRFLVRLFPLQFYLCLTHLSLFVLQSSDVLIR